MARCYDKKRFDLSVGMRYAQLDTNHVHRIDQLVIAKRSADTPDADTEALRAEIIKIDEEIRKLMKKFGDADTVLFEYIQNTVNEMLIISRFGKHRFA